MFVFSSGYCSDAYSNSFVSIQNGIINISHNFEYFNSNSVLFTTGSLVT